MAYRFIGACSGWGAQVRSCEKGPQDLLDARIFEKLEGEVKMLYPREKASDSDISFSDSLPLIHDFNLRLARSVKGVVERGVRPIVVAGDHSCAIGTWNGVYEGKKSSLPMGLLWIDAHMDSHTPETTPSGAWHGMPLAALLGFGVPEMAQLLHVKPVLLPEHVAVIGVRSFEEGEKKLLERLNVKVYYIEEVKKRGLSTVLEEAILRVNRGTVGFGVSIDVDVLDPKEAPGVGSPVKEGVQPDELLSVLPMLNQHPKLLGVEVVEYNPERDVDHKTRELVYQILKRLVK